MTYKEILLAVGATKLFVLSIDQVPLGREFCEEVDEWLGTFEG